MLSASSFAVLAKFKQELRTMTVRSQELALCEICWHVLCRQQHAIVDETCLPQARLLCVSFVDTTFHKASKPCGLILG